MNINILGSSSSGNCTIIDNCLMIDFGLNKTQLLPYLNKVNYIICTHRHGDHYNKSIITWLKKNRPELFNFGLILNKDCAELAGINYTPMNKFIEINTVNGIYELYLFPVKHDVECQGISIYKKETNELLIYATDLSILPDNSYIQEILNKYNRQDFDYILLEANYDKDILLEAMKNEALEDRAIRNLRHLSNDKWKLFVNAYSNDTTKHYQMHISEMFGKKLI